MLDVWFENGGNLFVGYSYIDKPSEYGSFGILEYQDQPIDQAPKYSAYYDLVMAEENTSLGQMSDKKLSAAVYPNPFGNSTTIAYSVPHSSFVSLKIFDEKGIELVTLVYEVKEPGAYNVEFEATTTSAGMYFYQLLVGEKMQTGKMILMGN